MFHILTHSHTPYTHAHPHICTHMHTRVHAHTRVHTHTHNHRKSEAGPFHINTENTLSRTIVRGVTSFLQKTHHSGIYQDTKLLARLHSHNTLAQSLNTTAHTLMDALACSALTHSSFYFYSHTHTHNTHSLSLSVRQWAGDSWKSSVSHGYRNDSTDDPFIPRTGSVFQINTVRAFSILADKTN